MKRLCIYMIVFITLFLSTVNLSQAQKKDPTKGSVPKCLTSKSKHSKVYWGSNQMWTTSQMVALNWATMYGYRIPIDVPGYTKFVVEGPTAGSTGVFTFTTINNILRDDFQKNYKKVERNLKELEKTLGRRLTPAIAERKFMNRLEAALAPVKRLHVAVGIARKALRTRKSALKNHVAYCAVLLKANGEKKESITRVTQYLNIYESKSVAVQANSILLEIDRITQNILYYNNNISAWIAAFAQNHQLPKIKDPILHAPQESNITAIADRAGKTWIDFCKNGPRPAPYIRWNVCRTKSRGIRLTRLASQLNQVLRKFRNIQVSLKRVSIALRRSNAPIGTTNCGSNNQFNCINCTLIKHIANNRWQVRFVGQTKTRVATVQNNRCK